ncbi:MAG: YdbL family protein [Pseudohongiellaceae bacterium]|nr:YdbL family protein [Pseudohongiellaceae bacterium]
MRNTHKVIQQLLSIAFILCSLTALSAHADALDDAKAAGLIGEKQDGYIGYVQANPAASIVALVEDINARRQQRYQQIARENNIPVSEVVKLAFARAVENTKSGHYVESSPGQWVRKP